MKRISLIAALGARTRAIGKDNGLLWSLPADMRRFRELTTGHPVIMGRKTWDSIPGKYRPLPGRTNIVITTRDLGEAAGAHHAASLAEALATADTSPGSEEIFVIGGGRVYADALPSAHRLYLTLVDDDEDGDTHFPAYETAFTKVMEREEHPEQDPQLTYLTLERT